MFASKPLVRRLSIHDSRVYLKRDLILHVAGIATLALLGSLGQFPSGFAGETLGLLVVGTLFTPLYTALVAAMSTVQDVRTPQYELLTLTPITNRQFVASYFRAAWRRLRLVLILAALIMPVLLFMLIMLANAHLLIRDLATNYYDYSSTAESSDPLFFNARLTHVYPPVFTPVLTVWLIGLWGMNLLGISFGVGTGIWWRHDILSPLGAVIVTLVCGAGELATVTYLPSHLSDQQILLFVIGLALLPYLGSITILLIASRFARQP